MWTGQKKSMKDPNSFDQEIEDVQQGTNPTDQPEGTEQTETEQTQDPATDPADIDYKTKFTASAQEGIRLAKENKELKDELAAKGQPEVLETESHESGALYPGFENLDPEAQDNLIKYTDAVTKRAQEQIRKDPAIAFAQEQYAKNKWESAFAEVQVAFPQIAENADDFRSKYFNVSNVPDNISDLLKDIAKIYMFDQAKEIGAEEAIEQAKRVEIEEAGGGEKAPETSRTLDEWQKMAASNPAEFAKHKKEYETDVASGKLGE